MPRRFGRGGSGFRPGMRRLGAPIIMPVGGWGMGSPLLTGLLAGGVGYALGRNAAQQNQPQPPPAPPPSPSQSPAGENGRLAQLQLLEELHNSGTLTNEEFEREKQRILRGSL